MYTKSNSMDAELWSYVSKFRDNTDNYTITSQMAPYHGKFRIERKNLEEFWDMYCESVATNPELPNGLAQRPGEYQPVRADIDLEIERKDDGKETEYEKIYTLDEAKVVISAYQRVIREISKEWRPQDGVAFLLEKETPYSTGHSIKGGFHVHFPRVWMRNCDYDLHIVPRVKKFLTDRHPELFKRVPCENSGDHVDGKVTNKHWLMYGACKSEKSGAYRFTKAFDANCCEISLMDSLKGYTLYDTSEDEIKLCESNVEFHLPRILSIDSSFLSIHPAPLKIVTLKTSLECFAKQMVATAKDRSYKHENVNISDAVEIAREIMPLISPGRADQHDDWLEMGWVLFNIGDGCQEMMDMWIDFSAQTSRNNFDETVCVHHWQKMLNTGKYSIGTLRHYAKQDSPAAYEKWCKDRASSRVSHAIHGGHNDLAKMLHDCYGTSFVYAPIDDRTGIWFEYRDHRWHKNPKGYSLREKISDELVLRFKNMSKTFKDLLDGGGDENEAIQKKIKLISAITKNLKSAPFKNSVMQECSEVFRNEDFLKKLDTDPNLTCFTNGIFDCKTLTFRDGRPDDYVSLCTGYDYHESTYDSSEVLEVYDFLMKVFPDPVLRRYFIEYCASLLKGGNNAKTFLNMSGSGDNAKSVVIELLELALGKGSYMIKFPTSLITGKRGASSSAAPELARAHGAKFAVLQEPDTKDVINGGLLKELTGNDSFFARGLFKDGGEITPQFKLALICNKLPRLDNDPATWNRIRVLLFESCFPKDISSVPDTFEEQMKQKRFPRDSKFSEKLEGMKRAFMWIMIQTYKEVVSNGGSPEPEKVTSATEEYRKNNDVYLQYGLERIKDDERASISLNEVFADFTQWFKDSLPNMKPPIKNDVKEHFSTKWGPLSGAFRWKGYRLRNTRDDIADKRAIVMSADDLAQDEEDLEVDDGSDDEEDDGRPTRLLTKN